MKIKTIDEILNEIVEDKVDNPTTTSFKFKTDLWNFFNSIPNSEKMNCVEFGTHKGQTTRVLSFLFKTVYTINLPGHFDKAKELNGDRRNIEYWGMDLTDKRTYPFTLTFKHNPVSVIFIDAIHTFDGVIDDFTRSKHFDLTDDVYFIFDDYGLYDDVRHAVDQLIYLNQLEKVQEIGHERGYTFENRTLKESEGLICKLIK